MSDDDSIESAVVVGFLTILGLAMYYTIIGASFKQHTSGTLIDADVYYSSGKNSDGYYRSETFKYNSTSGDETSCTLVRPQYYMYYGSVENAVKETLLGTTRELWIASYNSHTCSDKPLKDYNQTIGITLFCVVGIVLSFVLIAIFYNKIKKCWNCAKQIMDSGSKV